jgi:hypothetical protein
MVWIWQHDERTHNYKIILNCVRKLMKNKLYKEARKGASFKIGRVKPMFVTNDDQNFGETRY